jgi:hypothetical protein
MATSRSRVKRPAASPLTEGERIEVRGSDKSINRLEISLTLPLSALHPVAIPGEATRTP